MAKRSNEEENDFGQGVKRMRAGSKAVFVRMINESAEIMGRLRN